MLTSLRNYFEIHMDFGDCVFHKTLVLCLFFLLSSPTETQSKRYSKETFRERLDQDHWLHGNRTCRQILDGHGQFSKYRAASVNVTQPLVEMHVHRVPGKGYLGQRTVPLLQQVINRPLDTLSILEPRHRGACGSHRNGVRRLVTVRETASQDECLLAINAGFFNSLTGACLGNIVSDGLLVQSTGGIQNAHFGLTKDGYIFTGYPSKSDIFTQNFTQLVGGVIWLVKDGVNNVDQSIRSECPITQETGTMNTFASAYSGRSALGHDAKGRVHFLEVDGKTFKYGISLYGFADAMIQIGIVNAINLDGGGSVTVLANGDLVNRPSDKCPDNFYKCEREVSTAVCVHAPRCSPTDCDNHMTTAK